MMAARIESVEERMGVGARLETGRRLERATQNGAGPRSLIDLGGVLGARDAKPLKD